MVWNVKQLQNANHQQVRFTALTFSSERRFTQANIYKCNVETLRQFSHFINHQVNLTLRDRDGKIWTSPSNLQGYIDTVLNAQTNKLLLRHSISGRLHTSEHLDCVNAIFKQQNLFSYLFEPSTRCLKQQKFNQVKLIPFTIDSHSPIECSPQVNLIPHKPQSNPPQV